MLQFNSCLISNHVVLPIWRSTCCEGHNQNSIVDRLSNVHVANMYAFVEQNVVSNLCTEMLTVILPIFLLLWSKINAMQLGLGLHSAPVESVIRRYFVHIHYAKLFFSRSMLFIKVTPNCAKLFV